MASQYGHGYTYDLFVSYSSRDAKWVEQFLRDLVDDTNRFANPDIFPFRSVTASTGLCVRRSPATGGCRLSHPSAHSFSSFSPKRLRPEGDQYFSGGLWTEV